MAHVDSEAEYRTANLSLRREAKDWLDEKVPEGAAITSDGRPFRDKRVPADSAKRFFELTGASQKSLEEDWKTTSKTTCNAFCGRFSEAMRLGTLNHLDLRDHVRKDRLAAWIPADSGQRPKPGDIVLHFFPGFWHTNVTRSLVGDEWITVDGGQGGPKAGHDVITRVLRSFSESRAKGYVQGWIDIERYHELLSFARSQRIAAGALGHLWVDPDDRLVHPGAPASHGGPGGFRCAGPLAFDVSRTALWHPDAPADQHLWALGGADFAQGRG